MAKAVTQVDSAYGPDVNKYRPAGLVQSAPQHMSPYQGGLQTGFEAFNSRSMDGYDNTNDLTKNRALSYAGGSEDSDVRHAQWLTDRLYNASHGMDSGVNGAADQAALDMHLGRIKLKNSLAESISGNEGLEGNAEDALRSKTQEALGQGLKTTKENYNRRGLLYSGLREGGEEQIKGAAASGLGSGLSNTKREFQNLQDQQKAAYASIGLADQKAKMDASDAAFETVNRNSIARMQATQQLAGGLGQVAGYFASGNYGGQQPQQQGSPSTIPYQRMESSY